MSYTWSSITPPSGINPATMILLTDGSVLVMNGGGGNGSPAPLANNWYRYFPNAKTGLYANGTWSSDVYPMSKIRTWFASGILPDGRLFVFGSEYLYDATGANTVAGSDSTGEILDPSSAKPSWTPIRVPSTGFSFVTADVNGCILADGRVLLGGATGSNQTAIWDPQAFQGSATQETDAWTEAGLGFGTHSTSHKRINPDEETWTLLTDGSVLTVNVNSPTTSERYIPATDEWVDAGNTLSTLSWAGEMGPAVVMPQDGSLFAVGASGHTGIFTLGAASPWANGPDTGPATSTNAGGNNSSTIQTAADAPCCLLPNGKVLVCAGDPVDFKTFTFSKNAQFYLYDPKSPGAMTLLPSGQQPYSSSSGIWTYQCCLLLLPSGEVLLSNITTNLQLLTISAAENTPDAAWRPTITDAPSIMLAGHAYTITGTQFNGLSQACSYGDDLQNATNYPIVRLTSTGAPAASVYYCRSFNFSSMGIATGSDPQTATIQLPQNVSVGQYNLQVIANGIASDPFAVTVAQQDCSFVMEVETYSQGQINSMLQDAVPAVVSPAFGIAVEGFKPSELGFHNAADLGDSNNPPAKHPQITSPRHGLTFTCFGPTIAEDLSLPDAPQVFTYQYQANFENQSQADAIFSTISGDSESAAVIATFTVGSVTVVAAASITFTKSPNPFMLHGDALNKLSWVYSQDLRAFTILQGHHEYFNVTMGSISPTSSTSDVATKYISAVLKKLNDPSESAAANTAFEKLNDKGDDNISLGATNPSGVPIYNFCIARVRYQDTVPASNVRVFFRTWPGAQVAHYDTNTLFRSDPPGNGLANGHKVPLLGTTTAGGDEIGTIPFFATPRVNLNNPNVSMKSQPTDTPNLFVKVDPDTSFNSERHIYFGAWLDINQPDQKLFPSRLLGPASASFPDGPYTGVNNLVSIQELLRSHHQCLIAEISMDGLFITKGSTGGSSEHLAQRNLHYINVPNPGLAGSRRASEPFEIRPTPKSLASVQKPDEIFLEWSSDLPPGSRVNIYLPVVQASDVIKLANQMYYTHKLSIIDENTVSAPAGGVTYIPIPPRTTGGEESFVGLLTLDLPLGIRKGQEFSVVFKQVTNGFRRIDQDTRKKGFQLKNQEGSNDITTPLKDDHESPHSVLETARRGPTTTGTSIITDHGRIIGIQWRRVLGQFALKIPVSTKDALLDPEERLLSILRYIELSVEPGSRWYLVFKRYVDDIAGRVGDLGGDPGSVLPDPNGGVVPIKISHPGGRKICGKICSVLFDRCGCFVGFTLRTKSGERRFECREEGLGKLVQGLCDRGHEVCVYYSRDEVLEISVEKGHSTECSCGEKHTDKHKCEKDCE